jgi:hypothetical protein
MHIGRIISGTDGVMTKTCDTLDGSEVGVPLIACSLAALGRNGSGSTPAAHRYKYSPVHGSVLTGNRVGGTEESRTKQTRKTKKKEQNI